MKSITIILLCLGLMGCVENDAKLLQARANFVCKEFGGMLRVNIEVLADKNNQETATCANGTTISIKNLVITDPEYFVKVEEN